MYMSNIKIGVIISTTRPTRLGPKIAAWFMSQVANNSDADFELIDLKEVNLPFINEQESPSSGNYELEHTKKWSETIKGFDGFVLVTAEYNNGPPAPLKNALDSIYHEWDKKPVAFVGYGTYGATRAVEQLVNVTAKMGMVPLPKTFASIIKTWDAFDDNGKVKSEYVMGNVEELVENLLWWTNILKEARQNSL
jgi:NAD(P)H-dependent FMN reductase